MIQTMKTRWSAVMNVTEATTPSVLDYQTFLKVASSTYSTCLLGSGSVQSAVTVLVVALALLARSLGLPGNAR